MQEILDNIDAGVKAGLEKARKSNAIEPINKELKHFIKDVTLFLQSHKSKTDQQFTYMLDRAYNLYCKYDVENRKDKKKMRIRIHGTCTDGTEDYIEIVGDDLRTCNLLHKKRSQSVAGKILGVRS